MASEVLLELKASDDPLDRALARTLEAWQSAKRNVGDMASMGYEPRDIRKMGAAKLIANRVLNAASGFNEVGNAESYEQLVLDFPDYPEFTADVVQAAKVRLGLDETGVPSFADQPVQFLIKSTVSAMFGQGVLNWSDWPRRKMDIPNLHFENSSLEKFRQDGFVALVWIHEGPREGTKGEGLTGIIEVSPIGLDGQAFVLNSYRFKHAMRMDEVRSKLPENGFVKSLHNSRGDRIWPIHQADSDSLLGLIHRKAIEIATYPTELQIDVSPPKKLQKGVERLQKIISRPNQTALRKNLLDARKAICAITGPSVEKVLDAAHIKPFSIDAPERDTPENTLLLRADVHWLFDKFLISVEPTSKTIVVARELSGSLYGKFSGQKITDDIAMDSLDFHFEEFTRRQRP